MKETKSRIQVIDALRGLSVILMVAHHFMFDLTEFMGAPRWLFSNRAIDILQPVFAGVFIILSGVSSRFSRSNVKRGLKTAVCAAVVTAVSFMPFVNLPIWFGILHLLAFCMIFYGLLQKWLDRIPPLIYVVLWGLSVTALNSGLIPEYSIKSADWYPPIPWLFVFLFGTYLGTLIRDNRFSKWFYNIKIPVLPAIGRTSLIIYMVHQPVLYGIVMLLLKFM